ncbi:MAG TPA: symmetrical bis(5'-nucleosyl)-tetraphosphatase [Burkholderiales bacterium]|nr:symmetrical bis(5'-nucleosyl)-tetraphosphatase [Burkholderiales bacterium]
MSTYAIGDVQGCHDQLRRLLDATAYEPARDTLWFVGDLVNRGPQSLGVLRFVKALGTRAVTVLGNHDLALLVVAEGIKRPHASDTFGDILAAPDRDELLHWLRHQKMMHADGRYAMVHAGLLPQWSVPDALALAGEVEQALRSENWRQFLRHMYGNTPDRWSDALRGFERLRVIVNAMTRLRLCTHEGAMEFTHKLGLAHAPEGYMPWYDVPGRASRGTTLLVGHWAALGLLLRPDVIALDTGCVWGRKLTALRLDDQRLVQCDCSEMLGKAGEDWNLSQ